MAFPAVVGVASPADLAGMAPLAIAGMAFPAVAGVASLAVVEVASSTDLMEPAGSPSVCGSQSDIDCLIPDDFVMVPDVVVFPEKIELGDPTVIIPPVVRDGMSVTEGRHRDRDLGCTGGQAGSDVCLEEQELPRDNNEAIVVGAVGSGAPWFLTGLAEGSEVELVLNGCVLPTFRSGPGCVHADAG